MSHRLTFPCLVLLSSLLLALLVLPSLAHGATYYVAPSGQGSCSTNSNNPQGGLSNGIRCLSAGDTLILKSGTYNEGLYGCGEESCCSHPCIPDGTPGNPTTVKAEVMRGAVLNPPAENTSGRLLVKIASSPPESPRHDVTVDGLVIDMTGIGGGSGQGVWVNSHRASRIIIQNLEVKNGLPPATVNGPNGIGSALRMEAGAEYSVLFKNNLVHDMAYPYNIQQEDISMGFYMVGDHQILDGNTFYNIAGYCGESWSSASDSFGPVHNDFNIFRNNICHDSGGVGMLASGGDNMQIYNNIIYHNSTNPFITNVGIYVADSGWDTTNPQLYNNTIYNGSGKCIVIGARPTNAIVRNNICWGNGQDKIETNNGSSVINTNLCNPSQSTGGAIACPLYTDPSFVNAPNADFHLATGSAATGQGANLSSLFTTDFAGTVRTAPWDLGALKAGGGGVPAPSNLRMISVTNP